MKRGFTILEVVTVTAIVSMLMAVLLPAFAAAKRSGLRTQCLSNQRQIGASLILYMQDHDDVFPHAVDPVDRFLPEIWSDYPEFQARIPFMPYLHEALMPYLREPELFRCPSDTGMDVLEDYWPRPFQAHPSSFATFGTSYFYRTEIAFKFFTQSKFQLPSDVNVMFDAAGHWHSGHRALRPDETEGGLKKLLSDYRYNLLYGDMHVKNVSRGELQRAWLTEL